MSQWVSVGIQTACDMTSLVETYSFRGKLQCPGVIYPHVGRSTIQVMTENLVLLISTPLRKIWFFIMFVLQVPFVLYCVVVSIVSCRWTCSCSETSHVKITRYHTRYCGVAFCYLHKCELSCMSSYHAIKLHSHWMKLYQIGCVWSGLVLAKVVT